VIWHSVRFDFSTTDAGVRDEIEAQLAGLAALDVVDGLRIGRDIVDPEVTGLLVTLADEQALATYRDHPDHAPVVARIRDLGVGVTRFDIVTDDARTVLA
jgi:hypothetical protein